MKSRKAKSRTPILAAGGIVLRDGRAPQFAVVQLRKMGVWVLPKGKLAGDEDAMAAARREVLEETGHRVSIHEFLGTLAYEASGRPKVVQFWRMQALGDPVSDLTRDVKAVRWLPLEDAVNQLTHARERAFLEQVGPVVLKSAEQSVSRAVSRQRPDKYLRRARPPVRGVAVNGSKPSVPGAGADLTEHAGPTEQDLGRQAGLVPAADVMAPARQPLQSAKTPEVETAPGRNLIEKTLTWFRHATMPHRPPTD